MGAENSTLGTSSLNIMCYNILVELHKAGRPSDPQARMAQTILQMDTDVLGTQEDNDGNGEAFVKELGSYSVYKGANEVDNGNYVYWKTEKLNVLDKGYYYLSDTPEQRSRFSDSKHYRTMTYVVFEIKDTGARFLFIDTHLQNNNASYGCTDQTRYKQLCVLSALVQQINKDGLPVIIMGDLNTSSDAESIKAFKRENPVFSEAQDVALTTGDVGYTFAYNFMDREYTIDHIFVSTDRNRVKYFTVVDNKTDGKYPSDHLPLFAQIELI